MRLSDEAIQLVKDEVDHPLPMIAPATVKALLAERVDLLAIATAARDQRLNQKPALMTEAEFWRNPQLNNYWEDEALNRLLARYFAPRPATDEGNGK